MVEQQPPRADCRGDRSAPREHGERIAAVEDDAGRGLAGADGGRGHVRVPRLQSKWMPCGPSQVERSAGGWAGPAAADPVKPNGENTDLCSSFPRKRESTVRHMDFRFRGDVAEE